MSDKNCLRCGCPLDAPAHPDDHPFMPRPLFGFPQTPEELRRNIRATALAGEIRPMDTTQVIALKPYVRQVLRAVAEVMNDQGIALAFVTDGSSVSDFLDWGVADEVRAAQARAVAAKLDVEMPGDGRIAVYEVARILAARDGALA